MNILDSFKLDGKVAWVTGGCYGLGFACAQAMAGAGARIIYNGIHGDSVARAQEAYRKKGIDAFGAVCDVTDEEAVCAFAAEILRRYGRLDILVNNAGIIKRIPMTEMTLPEWDEVIRTDLTGPFVCAKAVLPHMLRQGSGKIVNICSMMSEVGRETVSAYAAAKGGLKMLTKSICSEYGQYNIQCNAIGPGYIATPQTAPLRAPGEDGSMHPFDRFIRSRTPAQRWGTPEDLMGLAVFLASPASDFINGQVIYIDGGILAYLGQDPSTMEFHGAKCPDTKPSP